MEPSLLHYHHMCWPIAIGIGDISWNPLSLLGCKRHHCAVDLALTQHEMDPTSHPSIYQVFDILHMMWIGIWSHYQVVTLKGVGPDLGSLLCPNWATTTNDTRILQWLRLQPNMKWFPHPVPESQHIEGVWQSSYAVDEHHIKQSSGCYHHMCWPRLRHGAEIQCLRWVTTNDTIQAPYQHKMGSTSRPSI